jgi:hypothetical protein
VVQITYNETSLLIDNNDYGKIVKGLERYPEYEKIPSWEREGGGDP